MGIATRDHPDVEGDLSCRDDRLPDVAGERGVVGADELDDLRLLMDEVRPSR